MLGWLTFAAALLAAIGAVIGPVIAYRASIRTIQAEQQIEIARQRQETVERLIEQATGNNPTLSTYALSQLDYLLNAAQLTLEQTTAARNAIEAVMTELQRRVGSAVQVVEDDRSAHVMKEAVHDRRGEGLLGGRPAGQVAAPVEPDPRRHVA